ncbi:putative enzyme related to lactoylglutathione lyase [Mesorhizobium robiniae]|uniref:Enzyme related to lactoylglutathione lyase n=1 Tax=Mesorhizobium robiniae TaxID=559315 RepID=A0ABV2GYA8_9HYPH
MRLTGKLDYVEMAATGGTLDRVKAFYSAAFSWSFTDYGPTYSAFSEGLDGGFQADAGEATAKPLPVLYSEDLEETLVAVETAGGTLSSSRSFHFLAAGGFHFVDPAGNEMAVWSE